MSAPERAVRQEAAQPEPPAGTHRAAARGRASSLTSAFPLPLAATPSVPRARRVLAHLAIPADLVNAPPRTLAAAHAHHREAAGQWNGWLPAGFRAGWGWLHLVVKAVLHAADWTLESPVRFLVAAAIAVACYFWL